VNNVGKSHDYPEYFASTPKEECDAILRINVDSLVNMTRLVVPGMTQRFVLPCYTVFRSCTGWQKERFDIEYWLLQRMVTFTFVIRLQR